MTPELTRQLGIEFERRIQTILPSTKTVDKIDTEDIYAFLNEYQNQFIKELYITKDRVLLNSNASNRIDDYLKTLVVALEFPIDSTNQICVPNFNMYIDSTSNVSVSYADKQSVEGVVGNDYVNSNQLKQILNDTFNKHRILRRPVIYMTTANVNGNTYFEIISDEYTTVNSVAMRYLKTPTEFTILGTGVACGLPYECFNELVSGAVLLFINYKRGGASLPLTASKLPLRQSNQLNNQQDELEDEE